MKRLLLLMMILTLPASVLAMSGQGMSGMGDEPAIHLVRIDQLEASKDNTQHWEAQAWYGNDGGKFWLRSAGELRDGRLHEADAEVLWYRPLTAFWGTQVGLRHDFGGEGPSRNWVALGVQGLAPYWLEVEATAYVGPSGRTAVRLRTHYDLLITQQLVLQPEIEANAYGSRDEQNGISSGLSDGRFALRLRYEIRRELAPYIGIVHSRRFGNSADLARLADETIRETEIVAGLRFWF